MNISSNRLSARVHEALCRYILLFTFPQLDFSSNRKRKYAWWFVFAALQSRALFCLVGVDFHIFDLKWAIKIRCYWHNDDFQIHNNCGILCVCLCTPIYGIQQSTIYFPYIAANGFINLNTMRHKINRIYFSWLIIIWRTIYRITWWVQF